MNEIKYKTNSTTEELKSLDVISFFKSYLSRQLEINSWVYIPGVEVILGEGLFSAGVLIGILSFYSRDQVDIHQHALVIYSLLDCELGLFPS